ncbi:CBS domain-containing protein [Sinosporangium siamense]|uniref:CBS domain-containing protein n=1 Tax=Sinosporangium siamense TaxID=1367973 RepID=A0A919RMD6_9ACTN|nr:CBS domain-containing protein [Sinosporangium siamense]GII95510.1 hypothetical protein Ssi02_57410 [Sinosporangium siamense]
MRTKVEHVMTRDVVHVSRGTLFKDVAETLIEHGISSVPVLDGEGRVVGVISEADLMRKAEFKQQYYGDDYRPALRARFRHLVDHEGGTHTKSRGETAGDLMTTPAVVTTQDISVVSAARVMDKHGVKRLPVINADGRLIGIVSRRDLIKVFLRDDESIKADVIRELPPRAVAEIDVAVEDGVVTLAGETETSSEAIFAVRQAQNVDGVVALRDTLTYRVDDLAENIRLWGGRTT